MPTPPQNIPDDSALHETLRARFGFDSFREGQLPVIRQLLAGHSALAIFPTGSGKSLCYQLTALHLDGLTIVISPLIALMKDQIDFLVSRGIAAARIDSSLPPEELQQTDAALRAGKIKLLYVAPERFANERFLRKLQSLPIALMVIDEAHCISEWGHNFRPDYMKLARVARELHANRVLALTATATPAVANDICREFSIRADARIHTGFYRPNLSLHATTCGTDSARLTTLLERLRTRPRGATIVYVTLQRTAEEIATALAEVGFPARAYHAGMEPDARATTQDWFMASTDAIVVATIAFGMGIDKAAIRHVYHYNLPKSLENYSQEIGRAGRDGLASTCEILACAADITVLENFTYGDTPDDEGINGLVDAALQNPNGTARQPGDLFDISTYDLSGAHDVRPLVVNTLLTYLELDDIIESTAPFYTEYQFQPQRTSAEILARFESTPERVTFLKRLFATAKKGRIWFTLNLAEAAQRLDTTRDRIVAALTYLEEHGDLTLKVAGLRHGYRIKKTPPDLAALKRSLAARFATRERNDIARVRQVIELLSGNGCLVRRLLAHFGEELGRDCGHCGPCKGEPPVCIELSDTNTVGLRDGRAADFRDRSALEALRAEHPDALATPRQCARFLCGLTSPRQTRARLAKHPLFGVLAATPFRQVMTMLG